MDLEKHFTFAISGNQTLQSTFEFVKFSDYLPLNEKYRDFFELSFLYAYQNWFVIPSKLLLIIIPVWQDGKY